LAKSTFARCSEITKRGKEEVFLWWWINFWRSFLVTD
jgi:hypothetical protein